MKKLVNKITDMLADAALLEMGVNVVTPLAKADRRAKPSNRTSSK